MKLNEPAFTITVDGQWATLRMTVNGEPHALKADLTATPVDKAVAMLARSARVTAMAAA